jgi:hypothetical protein
MLDSSQLLSACRYRSFPSVRQGEIDTRKWAYTWHMLASMANRAKRKRAIFCILLGFDTMDLVFKRSVDCDGAEVQLPYAESNGDRYAHRKNFRQLITLVRSSCEWSRKNHTAAKIRSRVE